MIKQDTTTRKTLRKGKEMRIFNLIIMTKKNYEESIAEAVNRSIEIDRRFKLSAIGEVMHSFEELKRNTWDVGRVRWMQKRITDVLGKGG